PSSTATASAGTSARPHPMKTGFRQPRFAPIGFIQSSLAPQPSVGTEPETLLGRAATAEETPGRALRLGPRRAAESPQHQQAQGHLAQGGGDEKDANGGLLGGRTARGPGRHR